MEQVEITQSHTFGKVLIFDLINKLLYVVLAIKSFNKILIIKCYTILNFVIVNNVYASVLWILKYTFLYK